MTGSCVNQVLLVGARRAIPVGVAWDIAVMLMAYLLGPYRSVCHRAIYFVNLCIPFDDAAIIEPIL